MAAKIRGLLLAVFILAVVGGAGTAFVVVTGRTPPQAHVLLGTELGPPIVQATGFLEDVKFKDLAHALERMAPEDRATVDPDRAVEVLLGARASSLELHDSTVVRAESDGGGNRVRVKVRTELNDLARGQPRTVELMLYLSRRSAGEPWYIRTDRAWAPVTSPAASGPTGASPGPGNTTPDGGAATPGATELSQDAGAVPAGAPAP